MLYCCVNCFSDRFIQNKIETIGNKGNCNFCQNKDVFVIDPTELRQYFEPLILLYAPLKSFSLKYRKKAKNCNILSMTLVTDWDIFNIKHNEVQNILECIFPELKNDEILTDKVDLLKNDSLNTSSIEVALEKAWQEFTTELKSKNRFFPLTKLDFDKIEILLQYLEHKINSGNRFYRARISETSVKIYKRDMGAPPTKKARAGRGNPQGISYLYLASDINTAISEVRPSILDYITVGEFTLKKNIRVIDLRYISPFNFSLSEDFENLVFNIGYLETLGEDLSKPINPRDVDLEYLPTQYLCELIKSKEWDGVLYNSSLSQGFNLALFSDKNIICSKTYLYRVGKPSHNYTKIR